MAFFYAVIKFNLHIVEKFVKIFPILTFTIMGLMRYKIKNTIIDFTENSVKINNELIDCPDKISQALLLFCESQNQTITKEVLINSLWGDLIVSDDSLFKVIQCVRKIFKENGLEGVLINVYGKGYKLKETVEKRDENHTVNPQLPQVTSHSIFSRYKALSLLLIGLLVLMISGYFINNQSAQTLLDTKDYLEYKTQLKQNPQDFLNSIDTMFNQKELDKQSRINILSLKASAHFALGHYEKLFEFAQKAIDLAGTSSSLAVADDLLNLAKVYYYRANGKQSYSYIKKAHQRYSDLKNLDGIYASQYIFLSLHNLAKKYELEFNDAKKIYDKAIVDKHKKGQIIALLHMYFASTELSHNEDSQEYVKQALEIALEINNIDIISTCYGVLAQDTLDKGQYIKAMKWANELLRYAVVQPNTNLFMQGFSYMYNILSPLGYNQLAEKYLQKGIDLQAYLNSEGHLHEAEINLGVLKIKLGKYKQAKVIFSQLSTYELSVIDRMRMQAWSAFNQVKMHENISAYATARETFYNKNSPNRVKFIAGIAYVIAAIELERTSESELVFEQLTQLVNDKWLIEYQLFLDLAMRKSNVDQNELKIYQQKQKQFNQRLSQIREQAKPNYATLKELDAYLEKVFTK